MKMEREMSSMKLFGSSSGGSHVAPRSAAREKSPVTEIREAPASGSPEKQGKKNKKNKKKANPLKVIVTILVVLAILAGLYLFAVYTQIPFIKNLRDAYIETAMYTYSHTWLAEWFIPRPVIDDVLERIRAENNAQQGIKSGWEVQPTPTPAPTPTPEPKSPEELAEEAFYETFWELDKDSFLAYVAEHPEVMDNGWDGIYVNASGLDDEGTSMKTVYDEQVLALDAKNKILLVRVKGSGFIGVLAVAKDPSQLSCCASDNMGSYGQVLDQIVQNHDGILGITGNGFEDDGGAGNGGQIAGFTRCEGVDYGSHFWTERKRIELREDNLLYLNDTQEPVGDDVTDAVEFGPALIVDGQLLVDQFSAYSSIQPRACIGQSERREILMLVIEGRHIGRSIGTGVSDCAAILKLHEGYQAMNLDGGTSAVMWYDGQYVTKCSNTAIQSRTLPNAWVYKRIG